MKNLWILLIAVAAWLALQAWILPGPGVPS
jgi:hypothetical protein